MTRAQAIAAARQKLAQMDGSWANASDEEIVNHIMSDPTLFVGNDPIRVAITGGGGSAGGGGAGVPIGGTPNFNFLPEDIPTTEMLSFWNRMYEIDRQFYEDVRQFGLEFAENQRQFNMQQAVREAELTGVMGGQPTLDARRFLLEARQSPDILGSIYASQGLPYNMNMQAEAGLPGYVPPYYGGQQGGGGGQGYGGLYNQQGQTSFGYPGQGGGVMYPGGSPIDPTTGRPWSENQYNRGMPNPYTGAPTPTYPGGYPTGGQAPGQDELDYRGNYEDWLNWFMQTRSGGQQGTQPPYTGGGGTTPGISIDQARQELAAHHADWLNKSDAEVAAEYYKQSGRLVQGYTPTEASRILTDFRQRLLKTGKPEFINIAANYSDQQLAQHLLGDPSLFVGDPGKEQLQNALGGGFGLTYGQPILTLPSSLPIPNDPGYPGQGMMYPGGSPIDPTTGFPWNDPNRLSPRFGEGTMYAGGTPPWIYDESTGGPNPNYGGYGLQQIGAYRYNPTTGMWEDTGFAGGTPLSDAEIRQQYPDYFTDRQGQVSDLVSFDPETYGPMHEYDYLQNQYGSRYEQLLNSPFVQALQGFTYGSPQGQGYGSDPNIAVPSVNQIPFNWYQGLSADEQAVTRSFYPGLTNEAFEEPFQNAIESFSGSAPNIRYRA